MAFRLSTEQFSYVGADLRRVVEPGRVSVQVGTSSADLPLTADLLLRGGSSSWSSVASTSRDRRRVTAAGDASGREPTQVPATTRSREVAASPGP